MKKGFTLAEVLITLAIIGVVAALTIPSVIINAREQGNITAFKKAVSVLNSAISLANAVDSEGPSQMGDNAQLMTMLTNKMNIVSSGLNTSSTTPTCTSVDNTNLVDGAVKITTTTTTENDTETTTTTYPCAVTTADGVQYILAAANAPTGYQALLKPLPVCVLTSTGAKTTLTQTECNASSSHTWVSGQAQLTLQDHGCTTGKPCLMVVDVNGEGEPNKLNNTTIANASAVTGNVTDRFTIMITEDGAVAATTFDQAVMAK